MLPKACFPVKKVMTARPAPYNKTSPSLRSTQYQKSSASNAPSVRVNGRMLGEVSRGTRGEMLAHYNVKNVLVSR